MFVFVLLEASGLLLPLGILFLKVLRCKDSHWYNSNKTANCSVLIGKKHISTLTSLVCGVARIYFTHGYLPSALELKYRRTCSSFVNDTSSFCFSSVAHLRLLLCPFPNTTNPWERGIFLYWQMSLAKGELYVDCPNGFGFPLLLA